MSDAHPFLQLQAEFEAMERHYLDEVARRLDTELENERLRTTIRNAHTSLNSLRIRNGRDYAFGSYYVQQAWNQLDEVLK